MTTAINEITQGGRTVSKEDQISARTIVMPNNVFGSYEALAARLSIAAVGAEIPIYVVPQTEVKATVRAMSEQTLTGPGGSVPTRRFELTLQNPGAPIDAVAVIDDKLRLVRFEIPSVGLLVVREDASSVATRAQTARNPTDADVSIPANGFNLAGTMTAPPGVAGRLRHPAVVLVGGADAGRPRRNRSTAFRCSRNSRRRSPTPASWSSATTAAAAARAADAPSRPRSPTMRTT